MRRLLSILLFAATLLPLLTPLLSIAAAAQAGLPACCRREGKHHCMGMAIAADVSPGHSFQAPRMLCPYQQRTVAVAHHEISTAAGSTSTALPVLQEPAALGQVECLRRSAFDRGRQKRGPPFLLS